MKNIYKIILSALLVVTPSLAFAQATIPAGGTGITNVTAGDILYAGSTGALRFTKLPIGGNGTCLGVSGGVLAYVSCGGGGSGGGSWSTTTSSVSGQLINYPNNNTDIVTIGGTSTSTARFWLDPNLDRFIVRTGNVGIGTTSPWTKFAVTGSTTIAGGPLIVLGSATTPISADTDWYRQFGLFRKDINDYAFMTLENRNGGSNSSVDWLFNNDRTTSLSYYWDLGFNSSAFNNPAFGLLNVPNAAYDYVTDGPRISATATTSSAGYFDFITGGFSSSRLRITSTGNVGMSSTSPASRLVTSVSGTATGIADAVRTAPLSTVNGIVGAIVSANASNVPFIQGIVHTTGAARALLLNPYGGSVGVGVDALPTGVLQVKSSSESSSIVLVSGPVNGLRLGTTASLAVLEGVDTTGSGSYQQLNLGGSSVALTTSGVERMRVTSTGVGIGTTTPARTLDVYGNASFSSISGDNSLQIGNSAGVSFIQAANLLNTSTKNLALQVSGGNVGIGTSTPLSTSNLHVGAGTTGTNDTNLVIDSGSGTGAEPQLRFNRASVLRSAIYVKSDTEALTFFVNGADRGVITTAGNFGAGTTSPVANLQVTNSTPNATTTAEFGRSGQNKGSCIKLYDEVGTAYYLKVATGGTLNLSATACASVSGF